MLHGVLNSGETVTHSGSQDHEASMDGVLVGPHDEPTVRSSAERRRRRSDRTDPIGCELLAHPI
jgi:hypothetical protein